MIRVVVEFISSASATVGGPYRRRVALALIVAFLFGASAYGDQAMNDEAPGYQRLVDLFGEWREFEQPPLENGAPVYTESRMQAVREGIARFRQRLGAIDIGDWPVERQVDWHLLRAEINGLDFHERVLKPWNRDPAFYQTVWTYQSDTPAHEGPTHHNLLELWTYEFPLSKVEQQRLREELRVIPPLLDQARGNLTGNAQDLWLSGIYNIRQQADVLRALRERLASGVMPELVLAVTDAIDATESFVAWLEVEAPTRNSWSGVSIQEYNWHLQQVWYVPLTWHHERRILQRELHRAWSSLKLEEHRNRKLPELQPVSGPAAYDTLAEASAERLMGFLEREDILRVEPWMDDALREQLGEFIPTDQRNFFTIGSHLDPTPLYTHFYHWFDLARMREEPHPSPLRRSPLLFNIFTSRAEGMATGFEELTMHAGLHDEHRRAREIVWILLAQRAARGLGSLDAQANRKTMTEAAEFHARWTPRQWMDRDLEKVGAGDFGIEGDDGYTDHMNLLAFEQQLYLRQPGYGTSYVTGKHQLEQMISTFARQRLEQGEGFKLSDFFERFNAAGLIPMSLIHWQVTGDSSGIDEIMRAAEQAGD
ncbi:MAG TPA: hypothetical protein VJ902_03020 [Wenzhouxiangellaceae bacterium]|nr:hypothetical protein [Wenzhouxiangellaceae bacterium]